MWLVNQNLVFKNTVADQFLIEISKKSPLIFFIVWYISKQDVLLPDMVIKIAYRFFIKGIEHFKFQKFRSLRPGKLIEDQFAKNHRRCLSPSEIRICFQKNYTSEYGTFNNTYRNLYYNTKYTKQICLVKILDFCPQNFKKT